MATPNNRMGSHHRFSDYEGYDSVSQQRPASRSSSRQINLPTSINITAPSPMGSVREVNRTTADLQSVEFPQLMSAASSSSKLNQHQRYSVSQLAAGSASAIAPTNRRQDDQMFDMASQLSLNNQNQNSQSSSGTKRYEDESELEHQHQQNEHRQHDEKSRSQLIDELLRTINDDSFNEFIDFNNKFVASKMAAGHVPSAMELANSNRPKSAMDGGQSQSRYNSGLPSTSQTSAATTSRPQQQSQQQQQQQQQVSSASTSTSANQRPRTLNLGSNQQQQPSRTTFDNVIRRMSTNFVQNLNKMSASTLGTNTVATGSGDNNQDSSLRREKSSTSSYSNSLYVDNQVPARRHSDNTINVPRIQVALSSPQASNSRTNLNQRATVSASKLANKWKLTAKTNQREAGDKLSPNLGGALSYMRRHSSGNTNNNEQNQSNGHGSHLLLNASPFKVSFSKLLLYD